MNSRQLAKHCGISYRQLDYWCTQGYLKVDHCTITPTGEVLEGEANPGIGYSRWYSDDEVRIAEMIARMVRFGVDPARAAHAARAGASLAWSVGRLLTEGTPDERAALTKETA